MAIELPEATVTVVWPTIGATAAGRYVGRLIAIQPAWDRFRLVSKCMAAATIPSSLGVFIWQLLPLVARRYRLTNRRIQIQKGLSAAPDEEIPLDDFDAIVADVRPGQAWLRSGDLVFQRDAREVFRLPGVPLPETFRQACLEVQSARAAFRKLG